MFRPKYLRDEATGSTTTGRSMGPAAIAAVVATNPSTSADAHIMSTFHTPRAFCNYGTVGAKCKALLRSLDSRCHHSILVHAITTHDEQYSLANSCCFAPPGSQVVNNLVDSAHPGCSIRFQYSSHSLTGNIRPAVITQEQKGRMSPSSYRVYKKSAAPTAYYNDTSF